MAGMEEGLPCGVEGFTPQGRGEGEILPGRLPLPSVPSHKERGVVRKKHFLNRDLGSSSLLTGWVGVVYCNTGGGLCDPFYPSVYQKRYLLSLMN